jgi:hypothetical protein
MRKTLSLVTILFIVTSCLVIGSAQTRRKRNTNVNRRVTRAGGQQRSAIGAGGAGTYARNGRGRYVTRNGKRIWVPQGSPAVGNRRGVFEKDQIPVGNRPPTRRVVEREQLELKKNRRANTNRP